MAAVFLYFVITLSFLNLLRMAVYLVTSDVYHLKMVRQKAANRDTSDDSLPPVTVIIPAYNEVHTIVRSFQSVANSSYPKDRLSILIANDGSTDLTPYLIGAHVGLLNIQNPEIDAKVLDMPNMGKAAAINNALQHHVKTELVMCLDSDSHLHPDALKNAVRHFDDDRVVALSSNVNIIEDNTLLSLVQRFEYIVCYQMKKGQALLDIEYIVGGIGSMFRLSTLKAVSYYDTNTMTEDIDLTMKIMLHKDKTQRIAYAADSIVYTEAAHSIRELMKQRYRWKYGRSQTFTKHASLFFSRSKNHRRRVSWFILPYSLLQDVFFIFEPLILIWFVYILFVFQDTRTLATALIVVTGYTMANLWATSHLSVAERLRLSYYAVPAYFLMIVLTWAEYYALIKAMILAPRLKRSILEKHVTWTSPARNSTVL